MAIKSATARTAIENHVPRLEINEDALASALETCDANSDCVLIVLSGTALSSAVTFPGPPMRTKGSGLAAFAVACALG
ncbi:hypothetical protein GCM10009861_25260 [Neomicrococcus aestuarii]